MTVTHIKYKINIHSYPAKLEAADGYTKLRSCFSFLIYSVFFLCQSDMMFPFVCLQAVEKRRSLMPSVQQGWWTRWAVPAERGSSPAVGAVAQLAPKTCHETGCGAAAETTSTMATGSPRSLWTHARGRRATRKALTRAPGCWWIFTIMRLEGG